METKTKIKNKTFNLHFIGNNYYTINSFEREAKRIGVNRAIPFSFLKNLEFNTPILLGHFLPEKPTSLNEKTVNRIGEAEIFGYFNLQGLSHNLPTDQAHKLYNKLNLVIVDNEPKPIFRACGSYTIGEIAIIKDSLPNLLEKIKELFIIHKTKFTKTADKLPYCICEKCKDIHLDAMGVERIFYFPSIDRCLEKKCECCTLINFKEINSFKWFITGQYTSLTPFLIKPVKFARGLVKIEVDLDLKKQRTKEFSIMQLKNYRLRKYMPELMRDRFI